MKNIIKPQESFDWYKTENLLSLLKSLLNTVDYCHKIELAFNDNISFDSFFFNV